MARTLASCQPSSPERRRRCAGFTLLELLVVLVLVSLVAGLVAPLAVKGLDAARERAAVAELSALLEGLPLRAFRTGATQTYDGAALGQLRGDLPPGWTLTLESPLRYSAAGVASGGDLRLLAPNRPMLRFRVLAVSGDVVRSDGTP